ncbi:MAG: fimbrillin family protein, partial [Muribaculaceae bacterium]
MNKILPLILLICWCLVSCSDEQEPNAQGTPIEIMVEVASYSQNVDNVSSRASIHTGVVTKFATGDDLGLIVLDKDGNTIINNYRFVVQKTGLAYRADADGNIISSDVYYNEDYTYIAYAPYNKDYDNYTSLDAIIARHKEKLLTDYADQSDKANYDAADLLICRTPQHVGTQLRLSFTHAMSQLKIYYNGDMADLTVEKPVPVSHMYKPDGSEAYWYISVPKENAEVYGVAVSKQIIDGEEEESGEVTTFSYWETYVNLLENHSVYISIFAQPTVSYKTAGVDMGFPSGCIWAKYNLGSESVSQFNARGGVWYDKDGDPIGEDDELMSSDLHASFDRGDYYGWGELKTKYEQPAVLFDSESGRITKTGDAYTDESHTNVTTLIAGSAKGYYPETYIDRGYTYASIDGNIAGTEYDVVRNKLWKGEWRIPNENEVDELFRYSIVEIVGWYYEDNLRYASWIGAKDAEGNYLNLHPDHSEFFGTENVRPY